MNLSRTADLTSKRFYCGGVFFSVGATLLIGLSDVAAEGVVKNPTLVAAANRCMGYGPGFVEIDNGTCVRSSGHVRVGARNANVEAWSTDGTSNAGLRSNAPGMLGAAGESGHLRIRNGLESLSPFR